MSELVASLYEAGIDWMEMQHVWTQGQLYLYADGNRRKKLRMKKLEDKQDRPEINEKFFK